MGKPYYILVSSTSSIVLAEKVNEAYEKGYKVAGGVDATVVWKGNYPVSTRLRQAMVLKNE